MTARNKDQEEQTLTLEERFEEHRKVDDVYHVEVGQIRAEIRKLLYGLDLIKKEIAEDRKRAAVVDAIVRELTEHAFDDDK